MIFYILCFFSGFISKSRIILICFNSSLTNSDSLRNIWGSISSINLHALLFSTISKYIIRRIVCSKCLKNSIRITIYTITTS
nr:MAG TPA: hypothetical protein [Caudoviricetes sp.]